MADSGQSIAPPLNEFYEDTDRDLRFAHVGIDATTASEILFRITDRKGVTTFNGGAAIEKKLTSGVAVDNAGQFTVSLVKADTAGAGGKIYYWEVRFTVLGKEDVTADGTIQILLANTD